MKKHRVVFWAMTYMAVFLGVLICRPISPDFTKAFVNIAETITPLLAGLAIFYHVRIGTHRSKSTKLGWRLIAAACFLFAIGQGIWSYIEIVLHQEAPFPCIADVAFIAFYPCLIIGIILISNIHLVVGRARILLDSAVVACSAAILSWAFLIDKLWNQSDASLLGKIISVFYPLGDIVCLFVALVGFLGALASRKLRNMFIYVGCGILLLTIADTIFTFQTLNGNYVTGGWADLGWTFGWFAMAVASYASRGEVREFQNKKLAEHMASWSMAGQMLRNFAPYAAAMIAMAVFFSRDFTVDGYDLEILALFVLIVLRQILMIVENVALNRQIQAMNASLECRVNARTQQLYGLQALTKDINSTLEATEVVGQTLKHALTLFGVEGCAIWLDRSNTRESIDWTFLRTEGFHEDPSVINELIGRPATATLNQFFAVSNEVEHAFLYAPLLWQNQKVGILAVARKSTSFDADEAALLESVSVEVGTALMNSWLHADALAAADQDAITGLLNHRAISQRLSRELGDAEEYGEILTIMLMDLNNFRLFNDTYGCVVGDHVLKTVADKVQQMSIDVGLAARYGGDEFLLILPGITTDVAEQIAETLRQSVNEIEFIRAGDDRQIPIGLSFGLATYPEDGRLRYELLVTAEKNLQNAKGTERGIARTTAGQAVNRELRAQSSFETLDILVDSIDNKDRYTRKHSEDVTEYALWIAEELNMSEETKRTVRMAGILHDVGKIGVPDEVLKKPGRLTDEEYEMMKRHPRIGELIVKAIPGMEGIVDGVRCHHERWDGKGYPDELAGEEIPLLGRILGVADAFSAMTTNRPYRKGMEWDVALEQIRVNKGSQFDPELADHFLQAVKKRKPKLFDLKDIAA